MNDASRSYVLLVQRTHGRCLTRARYLGFANGIEQEKWGKRPVATAPFGVELTFDDGECFSVRWDREFVQTHTGAFNEPLSHLFLLANLDLVDVGDSPEWSASVGLRVVRSAVHWLPDQESTIGVTPHTVELRFEHGRSVYFGLNHYDAERDGLPPHLDDVSVVFGDEAARQYRVGPYWVPAPVPKG